MGRYLHLQGKVYAAERAANGTPGPRVYLGNCPKVSVAVETNNIEHEESTSGQRVRDNRYVFGTKVNLMLTFDEYDATNMAWAIKGSSVAVSSGSITAGNDNMPSGMTAGSYFRTKHGNISNLVITDSAGSPATLTAGTHYRVVDAKSGRIQIIALTGTQPYRCAYDYGAQTRFIALNDTTPPELWVEVDGINVAAQSKRINFNGYRFQFDHTKALALLDENQTTFELEGALLVDSNYTGNADFGEYYSLIEVE